jgi:hypothetical protein
MTPLRVLTETPSHPPPHLPILEVPFPYAFATDPLGAPLLVAFEVGLAVPLSPTTRAQLVAVEADFGDLLEASEGFASEDSALPERDFALGALPKEAKWFAFALSEVAGETYAVPTLGQWKALHRDLLERFPLAALDELVTQAGRTEHVEPVLERWRRDEPVTWADALLLVGGLVEWVREGAHYVGMGAPRAAFYPNLYRPPSTVVRPISLDQRIRHFGFRCVRPI